MDGRPECDPPIVHMKIAPPTEHPVPAWQITPWLQIHGITCHPASRVEFFSSLLVLLSQYVASFSNETHVFGKIHFSACGGAEISLPKSGEAASRFSAYVEGLTSAIGHADWARPLRDYCVGLMMPCERKSVEPMAAITAPERTAAQHQSLLHFVGEGNWSDEKV